MAPGFLTALCEIPVAMPTSLTTSADRAFPSNQGQRPTQWRVPALAWASPRRRSACSVCNRAAPRALSSKWRGDFYRTFGMGSFCQFDLPRTTPLSWTFHGRGAAAKSSRTDFPIEFGGSSRKGPKSGIRRNRQGGSTSCGWGAGLIPAHCHPFPGGWSAIGIERRGSPRVGSSPLASLSFLTAYERL
jgi:hypothetical protein